MLHLFSNRLTGHLLRRRAVDVTRSDDHELTHISKFSITVDECRWVMRHSVSYEVVSVMLITQHDTLVAMYHKIALT